MEKSLLVKFLGDNPFIRVLDFLIENKGFDYSKTEISKGAEIGWSTLYTIWDKLASEELVVKTRTYGNTKLYKLNENNERVKLLVKLDRQLTLENLDRVAAREKKVTPVPA